MIFAARWNPDPKAANLILASVARLPKAQRDTLLAEMGVVDIESQPAPSASLLTLPSIFAASEVKPKDQELDCAPSSGGGK